MTIAMNTELADYLWESFVCFEIPDKDNYQTVSPCYSHEGGDVSGILTNGNSGTSPSVTSRLYSS